MDRLRKSLRRLFVEVVQLTLLATLPLVATEPLFGSTALSDRHFVHEVWQTEDGLPNNGVQSILQDQTGYLWLGTSRGLTKFDGVRFTIYSPQTGDSGLQSEQIWKFAADSRGGFWIAYDKGGLSYWRRGRANTISLSGAPKLSKIFSMCCDRRDRLFVCTIEGDTGVIEGGKPKELGRFSKGQLAPSSLVTDIDGRVWLASRTSLGYFQNDVWVPVFENLEPPLEIALRRAGGIWMVAGQKIFEVQPGGMMRQVVSLAWSPEDTNVRQMLEDREGTLWIATSRRGLLYLQDGQLIPVATSHGSILSVINDSEGNVWAGTQGGGLNRITESPFHILSSSTGLPNDIIHSLAEDAAGRLLLVPQSGGLSVLSNGVVTTINPTNLGNSALLCVSPDPDGGVWLGTIYDGLIHLKKGEVQRWGVAQGLKDGRIDALLRDSQGRMWIGYHEAGVACLAEGNLVNFGRAEGLGDLRTRVLSEDPQGRIWVGTEDGHLLCYENGRFESRVELPAAGSIKSIVFTGGGDMWAATTSRGVARIRGGSVSHISSSQGLPDDFIGNLVADESNYLWFGSSRGLFRADLQELNLVADGRSPRISVRVYGRSEGLADFTFPGTAHPSAWKSSDGNLWFASAKGAVAVNLQRLKVNQEPPPVVLEEVRCNGRLLGLLDIAEMPAGSSDWEFRYTALSFVAPERVRFRYRLVGQDADWINAGSERGVKYDRLRPGDYRFQVIASNSDGVWNEVGASFGFSIAPHFWQSAWFPWGAAVIGFGLAGFVARQIALRRMHKRMEALKHAHALEKERVRIAQDLHDELGAALTRIGLLADLARKDSGSENVLADLRAISNTTRESAQALDAIVWAVRPENDCIESFAAYMAKFAEELLRPAGLSCRFDVPQDLPGERLGAEARHNLFLAYKEALNNIVQHAAAKAVCIGMRVTNGTVEISVQDDGRGLNGVQTSPGHDGLSNIRSRLQQIGGELIVKSEPGQGTRLEMQVPARKPS